VSLPAADDLFRPTAPVDPAPASGRPADEDAAQPTSAQPTSAQPTSAQPAQEQPASDEESVPPSRRPSGRVRHDEKMTVYVTSEELLGLEHARLALRREHGLAVDRGRLVREAVAIALADLDLQGEDSLIVQRLQEP
jgi:hypothetical protein